MGNSTTNHPPIHQPTFKQPINQPNIDNPPSYTSTTRNQPMHLQYYIHLVKQTNTHTQPRIQSTHSNHANRSTNNQPIKQTIKHIQSTPWPINPQSNIQPTDKPNNQLSTWAQPTNQTPTNYQQSEQQQPPTNQSINTNTNQTTDTSTNTCTYTQLFYHQTSTIYSTNVQPTKQPTHTQQQLTTNN